MDNLGFDFRTLNFCILEGSQKVHEQRQKVKLSLHEWRWKSEVCFHLYLCESIVLDKNVEY